MVKIINVDKSQFIHQNIEIYSSNRIGQFSKFLDESPFYVTYFPVNEANTTTDLGTGNIDKLFGPNSPLRFNRIRFLPAYNIPELKPEVEMDDSEGVDVSMDISDITFLPGTIKPKPYDLMLIELPGAKQLLFRCTAFHLNSVMSNDFYMADFELKAIGDNLEDKVSTQIIDRYVTVFENIGTQDKCFIREEDVDKINTLVRTIEFLRDGYINNFYNAQTNSFLLQDNTSIYKVKCLTGEVPTVNGKADVFVPITSVITDENYKWVEIDYRHDEFLYDPFLEKFIMQTKMLEDPDRNETYVLTQNDIVQPDFESLYSRSLYWALEQHTTTFMLPFIYCYQAPVKKVGSVYKVFGIPVNSLRLMISGVDRFMAPEKKVEHAIESAVNRFEMRYQAYMSQEKFYRQEDYDEILKILRRAKIAIYEKRTVAEIQQYEYEIEDKLNTFKTEQQIKHDEIWNEMQMEIDNLDKLTYSDENIALLQEIITKYRHILDAAPFHVYDQIFEEFCSELNEVPQLTVPEFMEKKRNLYINKMEDMYCYFINEKSLSKEEVEPIFATHMDELKSSGQDEDNWVHLVDLFWEACNNMIGEENDNEHENTTPETPNPENPEESEDDPNVSKEPVIGEGEEEI